MAFAERGDSSPQREAGRGWSWLLSNRLVQPASCTARCWSPSVCLSAVSLNGTGFHLVPSQSKSMWVNTKSISSSPLAGLVMTLLRAASMPGASPTVMNPSRPANTSRRISCRYSSTRGPSEHHGNGDE